ncbi:hypothetical protein [Marinoscillum sp.]|uniref:hypothetical protein n=1 Tax=Marinoscillum sp. TaxID=2024838 RepID=UPI003BABF1EA
MKPLNTLVFVYNSFGDPLFQNLLLSYIKTLTKKVDGQFHIISFEQPNYRFSEQEQLEIHQELNKLDIFWHPLAFHTGVRFLLIRKIWDGIQALWKVLVIRLRFRTKILLSFANVASAMAILFKEIFRMTMIVYSYEPHSEFMVELGYWSKKSLKYRLLNSLEYYVGQRAEYILTGTKHMVARLKRENSNASVFRAPTSVDSDLFYYNDKERLAIRKSLSIEDRQVFIYVGKFGGLYYEEEIPQFFYYLKERLPDSYFLIVSPDDPAKLKSLLLRYLRSESFHIDRATRPEEVRAFVSSADIGISGVPPSPSQKYRSPTKVAEYLLCGLPYITTRGVSEDDDYALKHGVGVVLDSFGKVLPADAMGQIQQLIDEEPTTRRERCRKVGMEYRSKEHVDNVLHEIYKSIMQVC